MACLSVLNYAVIIFVSGRGAVQASRENEPLVVSEERKRCHARSREGSGGLTPGVPDLNFYKLTCENRTRSPSFAMSELERADTKTPSVGGGNGTLASLRGFRFGVIGER